MASCGDEVAVGTSTSSGTAVLVLDVVPAELTEIGDACVNFYRATQESKVEEAIYMRTFADRIVELGHDEAAIVLDDLANQWAVGVWDGR